MRSKAQLYGLLICITVLLFAFVTKTKHEVIFAIAAPKPIGPYSQAIKTKELVFVSGQIALASDGKLDTASIEIECKQVMENIKAILSAANLQMSDIVKSTIYTTDLNQYSAINTVYGSYFKNAPPARETIEVNALPKGAHVEISVIASE